jgi:hypothetical protein
MGGRIRIGIGFCSGAAVGVESGQAVRNVMRVTDILAWAVLPIIIIYNQIIRRNGSEIAFFRLALGLTAARTARCANGGLDRGVLRSGTGISIEWGMLASSRPTTAHPSHGACIARATRICAPPSVGA